jgi:hypothetical protein
MYLDNLINVCYIYRGGGKMKYDSVTKRVRNHEIYEYRKNKSQSQYGRDWGDIWDKRQRVSQIVRGR